MRVLFLLAAFGLSAIACAQERAIKGSDLRSGIAFAGADVRAMQADDGANPAFLWVGRGADLWRANCTTCHGKAETAMRGVAARYPSYDAGTKTMLDLDGRIEQCRVARQQKLPFGRESEDLLALSAYVALQSRGMPVDVAIEGPARAAFERGAAFYRERHGQMNLACTQCHDQNFGKRLYAETLSQGHGNAFPAYRLEWQGLGSMSRRIRACLFGVRAQMPAPGAPELVDVALYLAWRAQGLPMEAPGVRR